MKPLRSESPAVRIAVFASIAGGRRALASPVARALREPPRLKRARPATRPARGVS